MTTLEAFQIVLELARQNVIDAAENPEENQRQLEAIAMLDRAPVGPRTEG